MHKIIIMMGPPGSGKGTQAKKIAAKHAYAHISSGDLLRALALQSDLTDEEQDALEIIKTGKLVPDKLIYRLVFDKIKQELANGNGVVLDGVVRNIEQAQSFQRFFTENNLLDEVLVLEIILSDVEVFNRLSSRRMCRNCGEIVPAFVEAVNCPKCGGELVVRQDDAPGIIKERIAKQGNTILAPIIRFYKDLGLVRTVNGAQSIEQVEQDIETILK